MKYFASKLSDNLAETPEGYLLALNVLIGRTGEMEYGHGETPLDAGPDGKVLISRDADELFSDEAIASFQGKPLTIQHPEEFVTPDNWSELTKGIMQNVRRGSGSNNQDLVCDLLITDGETISLVKNGLRELSCGYEAEYIETGVGVGKQTRIRGNHLALVEQGRAGSEYAVRDHKGAESMKPDKKYLERFMSLIKKGKTVDEAMVDAEKPPTNGEPAVMDELVSGMKAINDKLDELAGKKSADADEEKPAPKKEKKEDKPAEDEEVESSLEDRLKALEAVVAKLVESKSEDADEEESEDEESDVIEDEDYMEDEESDKEKSKSKDSAISTDTKAMAEILSPGIQMSKDVKVRALKASYATKDGKRVIDALTGGKTPSFKDSKHVEMLFVSAAKLMEAQRNKSFAKTRGFTTGDEFQSSIYDQDGVMTPEKMNELNKKHYNTK